MSGGDNFLSRWSRRKIEARQAESEATPAAPAEPVTTPAPKGGVVGPQAGLAAPKAGLAGPQAESVRPQVAPGTHVDLGLANLPPVDALRGVESEYRGFLRPEVDDTLRRSALKKLFQDPHFNLMDGLDTYVDDYTKPDPISDEVLRTLNQAQGLVFDREEDQKDHNDGAAQARQDDKPGELARSDAPPAGQAEAPVEPPVPPTSADSK